MLDDDEFKRLLGAHAAATDQMQSSISTVAELLGQFRSVLLAQGFTTTGAEDLAREWFVTMLDAPAGDE